MYWDTWDYPLDSEETLRIKSHRRKSNHYELKKNSLSSKCSKIKNKITEIKSLGINFGGETVVEADVMRYKFHEAEGKMLKKIESTLEFYEDELSRMERLKNDAETLYYRYRNLAEGG